MPKTGIVRRATFVALYIFMLCTSLGNFITITKPSFAAITIVERPEDELLILELYINEYLSSRGFLAYLPQDYDVSQALIPLRALGREMSVSIDINPSEGVAEGFFVVEKNVFRLDLEQQKVLYNAAEHPLEAGIAEAHYGDIYVQARALEEWFDLKIRVDIPTLRLHITSAAPLPFEEKMAREKRAKSIKGQSLLSAIEYTPGTFLPYKNFTMPSVVLQDTVLVRQIDNNNIFQNSFSVQSYNDNAKFGTRFLLSGLTSNEQGTQLQNAQLTFRKRDPGQDLLGPLHAGSIVLGDVDFPDVPLFSGRKRGAGVFIASNPQVSVSRSFGSDTALIDGDAPIGWDAELYRNGYFVDFQAVGDDGRYSFEDVELVNGFNLFKIELYGPEGQKETRTQKIVRGGELLEEGEVNYEFAAGAPDADFLPITENRRTNRDFGTSGQVSYGVKNYLTLGASVFSGTDRNSTIDSSQTAASVSAIVPFLGFRNQIRYLQATDNRSGYEFETSTQVAGANISLLHTVFDGFDEDDEDLKRSTNLSLNRNFGAFSSSVELEDRSFLDQEDELLMRSRLSTRFWGFQLSNSLERVTSKNEAQRNFDGELSILSDFKDWRLRGNLSYNLESDANQRLQNIRLSAFKNLNEDSSIRLNTTHNYISEITSVDARYNRQFDSFSVDLNAGAGTDDNYFAGVTMRTALQPDLNDEYNFVNSRDGGLGSVGLRAFIDANNNNVFDVGEAPIEGISFRSNQGRIEDQTDADGIMFIRGLGEAITRFSLQESTLPSIYLKPELDYIDVIPRVGTTRTIDVAFVSLGEIDGFVYRGELDENGEKVGAPGIVVSLLNAETGEEVETTTTEYDGFYIFSALKLGTYKITTEPSWTEDPASLPTLLVTLTGDDNIQTDQNFDLPAIEGLALQTDEIVSENTEPVALVEPAAGTAQDAPYFIQLGSYQRIELAQGEESRIKALNLPELANIMIRIMSVPIEQNLYHRVVGAVQSYKEGQKTCPELIAKQAVKGCITIKNSQ